MTDVRGGLPDVKGSTVLILRVLYESLIPTKNAQIQANNLLLSLDVSAATTYSNLPKTETLSANLDVIDQAISNLPNDKGAIRDGFQRRSIDTQAAISNLVTEFQEKITPLYNKDIKERHQRIRSILTEPDSVEKKAKMQAEIEALKTKTAEFERVTKTYKSNYEALQAMQLSLRNDVARNITIPEETPAVTPTLRGGSSSSSE